MCLSRAAAACCTTPCSCSRARLGTQLFFLMSAGPAFGLEDKIASAAAHSSLLSFTPFLRCHCEQLLQVNMHRCFCHKQPKSSQRLQHTTAQSICAQHGDQFAFETPVNSSLDRLHRCSQTFLGFQGFSPTSPIRAISYGQPLKSRRMPNGTLSGSPEWLQRTVLRSSRESLRQEPLPFPRRVDWQPPPLPPAGRTSARKLCQLILLIDYEYMLSL